MNDKTKIYVHVKHAYVWIYLVLDPVKEPHGGQEWPSPILKFDIYVLFANVFNKYLVVHW